MKSISSIGAVFKSQFNKNKTNKLHEIIHKNAFSSQQSQPIGKTKPAIIGKKLFVWGQLSGSSLGLGALSDRDSSLPIELGDIDGTGYRDISLGTNHTGVVTGKGDVYVFGSSNYGELGLNEQVASNALSRFLSKMQSSVLYQNPTKIDSLSNITKISCGERHTACIDENGQLFTWGWGGRKPFGVGGLGHGNKNSLNKPTPVTTTDYNGNDIGNIIDISCGQKHSLCLNSDGTIYAFGEGEHGRLGTGNARSYDKPYKLSFFNNIEMKSVFAAKEYSFGLAREGGLLYAWGRNDRGQMGQGGGLAMDMYSCDPIPQAIDLSQIVHVSLSQADVLCVDVNGICYYWGERVHLEPQAINQERFIGDDVPDGKVVHVLVTSSMMCFVTDRGEIFSCNKTFGMKSDIFALGHGPIQPFKIAKRIEALQNQFVTKISGNDYRCVAVTK